MKFLKNNIKLLIGLVIGAVLTGGIVYAATSASLVTYTRQGTSIKNVEEALNDLYNINHKTQQRVVIDHFHYDGQRGSGTSVFDDITPVKSGTITYDISKIIPNNYQNMTIDNFSTNIHQLYVFGGGSSSNTHTDPIDVGITSYENGILTVSFPMHTRGSNSPYLDVEILAYYIN